MLSQFYLEILPGYLRVSILWAQYKTVMQTFSNPTLSFLKTLIKDEPLRKQMRIVLSPKEKSNMRQEARSKSPTQGQPTVLSARGETSPESVAAQGAGFKTARKRSQRQSREPDAPARRQGPREGKAGLDWVCFSEIKLK